MRRFWAVACLVLFVGLQFAAVSEQLHAAIHPDANAADHTCVIKVLSQGQVDVSDAMVLVPAPESVRCLEPVLEFLPFPATEYLLQFGRAPPSFRA
jgi:hypothetical protein